MTNTARVTPDAPNYTSVALGHLEAAATFRLVLSEELENPAAQARTINGLRDDIRNSIAMANAYAGLAQAAATRDLARPKAPPLPKLVEHDGPCTKASGKECPCYRYGGPGNARGALVGYVPRDPS